MESKQEKELIQEILSSNPQDEQILKDAGIIAEHQEPEFSLEEDGELILAEDAEYLESLSDDELKDLATSFDEIFSSLEREGCGDLAEVLYDILYNSQE